MHRNIIRTAVFAAAVAVLALVASPATAAVYDIDGAHSSATFKVKHLAISTVSGGFGKVSGKVTWDPADPTKSVVDATIDTSSIDTQNAGRDEHLKSPDFFDVATHPTITFKSTKVEPAGDGRLKVTGDLTLRGVTKPVVLDVEGPVTPIKDPRGNMKTGATATTKINRQDFGVSWSKTLDGGGLVVSDDVWITIELELAQAKDTAAAAK